MSQVNDGDLLWEPSAAVVENANMTHYMRWLEQKYGLQFKSYRQLWQWSVTDVARFWQSIWQYFDVKASEQPSQILAKTKPLRFHQTSEVFGAKWFVGARLNYAENIFRHMYNDFSNRSMYNDFPNRSMYNDFSNRSMYNDFPNRSMYNDFPNRLMTGHRPAILYKSEVGPLTTISWQDLYTKTAQLAAALKALGVQPGDRVVAYLPNIPESVVALLATSSLGAIWSSCSPEFGKRSVLDRFSQIEPKVLLAVDGYTYNGKEFDRLKTVAELQAALPALEKTILVPLLSDNPDLDGLQDTLLWDDVLSPVPSSLSTLATTLEYEQVPFDHPLWVLYSSGTTGLPKPIVHGHGGIILEHLKELSLHMDLKPSDRFFWYTNTGWMMWNYLGGGLLTGCTIILYNGSPGYPDMNVLWQLAEEAGMTYFGTSAAYIHACMKAGIKPSAQRDLSRIRAVGSTGSPLSTAGFQWVYENVNRDLALESFSGGTDLCTGFVGGIRLQPIYAGEIQGPSLGAKVQAFDEAGEPVVGEVGELVITEPMPSMPLFFWNDEGNRRYQASYFDVYPGVWRHGDWIKFNERGGCVIYGRSDSTINRHGVRMGTSEIYQAVESLPEIVDSLVIDLETLGQESYMPLFVVLRDGAELDGDLIQKIKQKIREDISPRFVPDEIMAIKEIPYTLSGKKLEVPIRRILLGQAIEKAANPGALRNPAAMDFFVRFAEEKGVESRE